MACRLYDWHGGEIVSHLSPDIFNEEKEKQLFYKTYASKVGEIVGFKEPPFPTDPKINNWEELFNRIYKGYKEEAFFHQPPNALFNSFAQFFDFFFVKPYEIDYSSDGSTHHFKDDMKKVKDHQEKKRIEFIRGINLPLLFYLGVDSHKKKFQRLSKFNECVKVERVPFSFRSSSFKRNLEGILSAEFSSSFRNSLFNVSEDCIFITYSKDRKELTLQKYWIASLLHMYHQRVYSLDFIPDESGDSRKIRNYSPHPLLKIILIETDDKKYPLIVEGVLGASLDKIKIRSTVYKDIRDFIDLSLWRYFKERFQKDNPKAEILYFPYHSPKKGRPFHQFDEHILSKYRTGYKKDVELELQVALEEERIAAISNTNLEYRGEQFSEAVSISNQLAKKKNEMRVGAFIDLNQKVRGASSNKYVDGSIIITQRKKRKFLKKATVLTALTCGLAAGGYLFSTRIPAHQYYFGKELQITVDEAIKGMDSGLKSLCVDGGVDSLGVLSCQAQVCTKERCAESEWGNSLRDILLQDLSDVKGIYDGYDKKCAVSFEAKTLDFTIGKFLEDEELYKETVTARGESLSRVMHKMKDQLHDFLRSISERYGHFNQEEANSLELVIHADHFAGGVSSNYRLILKVHDSRQTLLKKVIFGEKCMSGSDILQKCENNSPDICLSNYSRRLREVHPLEEVFCNLLSKLPGMISKDLDKSDEIFLFSLGRKKVRVSALASKEVDYKAAKQSMEKLVDATRTFLSHKKELNLTNQPAEKMDIRFTKKVAPTVLMEGVGPVLLTNKALACGKNIITLQHRESDISVITRNFSDDINKGTLSEEYLIQEGNLLYFSSKINERYRIGQYNINRAELRWLVSDNDDNYFPRVSPNNQYLAYVQRQGDKGTSLQLLDLQSTKNDDKDLVTLMGRSIYDLSWSPDATNIAFCADEEPGRSNVLYILNLSTKKYNKVDTGCLPSVNWSPSGEAVSFSKEVNIEGHPPVILSALYLMTNKEVKTVGRGHGGYWSSDGTLLAYLSNEGEIYITDSEGERKRPIAQSLPEWRLIWPLYWPKGDNDCILSPAKKENSYDWVLYSIRIDDNSTKSIFLCRDGEVFIEE